MISAKKKYVIQLFLKKCTVQSMMKSHIDFSFKLLENMYGGPGGTPSELKKKYSIDDYIERLIPVLDQYFTIEEMQKAIQFYSKNVKSTFFTRG